MNNINKTAAIANLNEATKQVIVEKLVALDGTQTLKINGIELRPITFVSIGREISQGLTGTISDAKRDMGIFTSGRTTFYFGDFCEEFRFDDDVVAFDQPAQKIADTLAARVATVRRWVQSCRGKGEIATAIIPVHTTEKGEIS